MTNTKDQKQHLPQQVLFTHKTQAPHEN